MRDLGLKIKELLTKEGFGHVFETLGVNFLWMKSSTPLNK